MIENKSAVNTLRQSVNSVKEGAAPERGTVQVRWGKRRGEMCDNGESEGGRKLENEVKTGVEGKISELFLTIAMLAVTCTGLKKEGVRMRLAIALRIITNDQEIIEDVYITLGLILQR